MAVPVITVQLDKLESALPTVPARYIHLQRALAGAAYDTTAAIIAALAESTRRFVDTAKVSGKTVTGQARAASGDVVSTARTGLRTVAGQAGAQGAKVSGAASREATSLIDSAIEAVDDQPGSGHPYEQWTKAQLLERATELNITGRYGLDKDGLIAALRSAA